MCHIRSLLYNGCYHNERILTLCDKQHQKQLKKYLEQQRRAQKSRGFFASLFSSSTPRPLIRPTGTFSYTSFDIPKDVLRYSCRSSNIPVQSTKYPDACPDCQSSSRTTTLSRPPTLNRPRTLNRPTTPKRPTTSNRPTTSGRPPTRRGAHPTAPVGRPVHAPAPHAHGQGMYPPQPRPVGASSQRRRPVMHPRSRDSIIATAVALPPSYPVGPTGPAYYAPPARASVSSVVSALSVAPTAARGSVNRCISPLGESRYERMASSSTRRVDYRLDARGQQPYQAPW